MAKPATGPSLRPLLVWLAGFSLILGGTAYWAVGTPTYALYRIHRSVTDHDPAAFRQYVDTRAVTNNAVDALMDDANELVWGEPDPGSWQAVGRHLSDAVLHLLRPKLHELAAGAVERQLSREFLKLDRPQSTPPRLDLISLDRDGRVATAQLRVEGATETVRIVLEQGTDRRWRVVVVDQALLKRLILQERQSRTRRDS